MSPPSSSSRGGSMAGIALIDGGRDPGPPNAVPATLRLPITPSRRRVLVAVPRGGRILEVPGSTMLLHELWRSSIIARRPLIILKRRHFRGHVARRGSGVVIAVMIALLIASDLLRPVDSS